MVNGSLMIENVTQIKSGVTMCGSVSVIWKQLYLESCYT